MEAEELKTILGMVADGRITPEQADLLIGALAPERPGGERFSGGEASAPGSPRHLRLEVLEGGQRVVNLRVPAGLATSMVPGLSAGNAERVRAALLGGLSGRILEVVDEDGDGVVISAE